MDQIYEGATFASFCAFEKALVKFENETFVNYTMVNTTQLKNRGEHDPETIEKFKYAYICFKCKFYKKPPEGKTVERATSTYCCECPASFKLSFDEKNGAKKLIVKGFNAKHENHTLSLSNYLSLPKQRNASLKNNPICTQAVLKVESKVRDVQKTINQSNQAVGPVLSKDLHNERARMLNGKKGENSSEVQAMIDEMTKIPDTIVKVFVEDNIVHGVFFQNNLMKISYEKFPEVLFCDATYNVSSSSMALQLLMIVDGNGDSQVAAVFIINSENIKTMTSLLQIFKEENPDYEKTEIIMVDKHAANLASFEQEFPLAQIHLCIFHIVQIFQREVSQNKLKIHANTKKAALQAKPFPKSYEQQIRINESENQSGYFSKSTIECTRQRYC